MNQEYIYPFPGVVRIEPSGVCNLACSHCPTGTVSLKRGVMRQETFEIIYKMLQKYTGRLRVIVLYHGGEPLLNKSLPFMVRQCKTLGNPLVKTVTNGMLLTEAGIRDIVDSGLDQIEFSLDGQSPEANNFIRRKGDYATVAAAIERLVEYKRRQNSRTPQVYIATTQILPASDPQRALSQSLDPPEYLVRRFARLGDEIDFKCTWAMEWPDMHILSHIYGTYEDSCDDYGNLCDQVKSTLTIRWNGDVVACCYDLTGKYVLGNVHESDLETIWNNKSAIDLRRSIESMRYNPLCVKCNVVRPDVYLTMKSVIP